MATVKIADDTLTSVTIAGTTYPVVDGEVTVPAEHVAHLADVAVTEDADPVDEDDA